MTKINKLGKSTFVIAILSFLLVAVLAFGGTYAYFSAQSKTVSGEITTGHLRITKITEKGGSATLASTTQIAQPNEIIYNAKQIDTTVTSNISYYTRVRFTVDVKVVDGHTHANPTENKCGDYTTNNIDILKIDILNGGLSGAREAEEDGEETILWEASSATAQAAGTEIIYYQLAPTIIADGTANTNTQTESFTFTIQVRDWVGNNGLTDGTNVGEDEDGDPINDDNKVDLTDGCEYWMDATVTVKVVVEVLQAEYLNAGIDNPATDNVDEAAAVAFPNGAAAHTAWTKALGTVKNNSVTDQTGQYAPQG